MVFVIHSIRLYECCGSINDDLILYFIYVSYLSSTNMKFNIQCPGRTAGISGNETFDLLAKLTSSLYCSSTSPISWSDFYPILKNYVDKFRAITKSSAIGKVYFSFRHIV
jgi:hypothetical protein